MSDIRTCPHCSTRVLPVDGVCPACRMAFDAPVAPPPPPPPKPRRRPVLTAFCLLVIGIGFARYVTRTDHGLGQIVGDLVFIWLGAIGLMLLLWRRSAETRKRSA